MNGETPQRRRDPRLERLYSAISFYRTAALILLAIAVVEGAVIIWQSHRSRFARAIRIDGQIAAYVRNERVAEDVRQRLIAFHKGDLPGPAVLEQKWQSLNWPLERNDEVLSAEQAFKKLRDKVTATVTAYAIRVGETDLVVVPSEEVAEMALKKLKSEYSGDDPNVIDVSFLQDSVFIKAVKADPGEITRDVHEAVTQLKEPAGATQTHVVKKGESWQSIADDHKITKSELRSLNSDRGAKDPPIGAKVNVPGGKSSLIVVTVRQETRTETFKAPKDEVVPVDTLPPGERRVTDEGTEGKRQITERVVYHNGKAVKKEIVDRVTIKEAVPRRIMEGKRPPGHPVSDIEAGQPKSQ